MFEREEKLYDYVMEKVSTRCFCLVMCTFLIVILYVFNTIFIANDRHMKPLRKREHCHTNLGHDTLTTL